MTHEASDIEFIMAIIAWFMIIVGVLTIGCLVITIWQWIMTEIDSRKWRKARQAHRNSLS